MVSKRWYTHQWCSSLPLRANWCSSWIDYFVECGSHNKPWIHWKKTITTVPQLAHPFLKRNSSAIKQLDFAYVLPRAFSSTTAYIPTFSGGCNIIRPTLPSIGKTTSATLHRSRSRQNTTEPSSNADSAKNVDSGFDFGLYKTTQPTPGDPRWGCPGLSCLSCLRAIWPNSEHWVEKQTLQRKFTHPPKNETTSLSQFCCFRITG